MIRFFNTLSGDIEPFKPLGEGDVKLYTCGPTVYDFPHIGNLRSYVFEDLLKRFLVFMGFKVTHVMNITDVDDKTIKGAQARRVSLREYTQKYIDAFFEDLRKVNIIPADIYPRATEHIPEMAAIVKGLLEKGFAYKKDDSVYFSIAKFPAYGRLSKIRLDDLEPGQRVEADEYEKESVHDFALWKAPKPGEPFWETEIGPGRPGWHIECSAMSSKYLGDQFDIHCGGVDNIFPHHENEIAQSEAFFGKPFVRYWLHCHHLVVDGEKMSKSKGNFFLLSDLIEKGIHPLTLRTLLISTHYRKLLNFTFEAVAQAQAVRQRLLDFVLALEEARKRPGTAEPVQNVRAAVEETRQKLIDGLGDDLNISPALAALFDLVKSGNKWMAEGSLSGDAAVVLEFVKKIDEEILGIGISASLRAAGSFDSASADSGLPVELQEKISARERARKEKNFKLADEIRSELLRQGIILEDTRDGVRWKRVGPLKQA
jgi:cysteinyl-tRNA synthetase